MDARERLRELDSVLFARYEIIVADLGPLVAIQAAGFFPGGNDHGPKHVERVAEHFSAIVGATPDISALEIFAALVAIFLHDAGLIYGREDHNKRSAEIFRLLKEKLPLAASGRPTLENAIRGAIIGHSSSYNLAALAPPTKIEGIAFRPRLVAALVRLADELDEDMRRADPLLAEILKIHGSPSDVYWKYNTVVQSVSIEHARSIRIDLNLDRRELLIPYSLGDVTLPFADLLAKKLTKIVGETAKCNQHLEHLKVRNVELRFVLRLVDGDHEQGPILTYDTDAATELRLDRIERELRDQLRRLAVPNSATLSYPAPAIERDLERWGTRARRAVDGAIELYRGLDLATEPLIPVEIVGRYDRDKYRLAEHSDATKLVALADEWTPDPTERLPNIAEHLGGRFDQEGSKASECKVGFAGLDYSHSLMLSSDGRKAPLISVRPMTYWVTRQFNKEIAMRSLLGRTNREYASRLELLHHEYGGQLLRTGEDFRCRFPSQFFIELAVVTADNRIPLLGKSEKHSVYSLVAGRPVDTCGPELGFVWDEHVDESSPVPKLRLELAVQQAMSREFSVVPSEIERWEVSCVALQHLHLNTALLGVVKVKLQASALHERISKPTKSHTGSSGALEADEILPRVYQDFGQNCWHGTALLRLMLAGEFISRQ